MIILYVVGSMEMNEVSLQGKHLVVEVFREPPPQKNYFLFIVEVTIGGKRPKVFVEVF